VVQLRNKIGEDLSDPTYILTEAGVGYRLNLEPLESKQIRQG
jgi:DNA-binding response OmpR family regulator